MGAIGQARPRTVEQLESVPDQPAVAEAAHARGVFQVVHFTTVQGAVGALASGGVLCRRRLPREAYLEHVYSPNARDRSRDAAWHGYVNLSVTHINDWMFDHSERWHISDGVSWVVLAFSPEILAHPGVVFCTTNSIYPTCSRQEGLVGFEAMFGDEVTGRYGRLHVREDLPANVPTDRQAEVLYPDCVDISWLERIDVQSEAALDDVAGAVGVLGTDVPYRHAPEVFQ